MGNDLLAGKRGLIMGLANDKSIAWGIAKTCADAGSELAFSYQGEALKKRVGPLAEQLGSSLVIPCDVADETSIDALFETLKEEWGTLDFIVHAIGFSDKGELRGRYVDTSRDNFTMTMGHLGLLFHRRGTACRKDDEPRRILPDHDLLRRGKSYASL